MVRKAPHHWVLVCVLGGYLEADHGEEGPHHWVLVCVLVVP